MPTEMTSIDDPTAVDGRVLRGQKNREAIVDAMVAMYEKGNLRPTAAQVADEAGLSTRSVYHHFDDMTSLIYEVSSRSEARVESIDPAEFAQLPLAERIDRFAAHRFHRWSTTAAVVSAGRLAEYDSKVVEGLLKWGMRARAEETKSVFCDHLREADDPEAALDGLEVAFGYDAWLRLTVVQQLSAKRATKIVAMMAASLL